MEHQFFEGIKFYQDKKTGYWISTTSPRKRMHVVVWEFYNGNVPKGCHVHHLDEDKSNNVRENLEIITARDHFYLHMTSEKIQKWKVNINKIRPMTKEWHASSEGHEWHVQHGLETWNERKSFKSKCLLCNEEFETKTYHQAYCSNKCKSAHRRQLGLDNIEVKCEYCKRTFSKNRFSRTRFCSKGCGGKARQGQKHKNKAE